MKKNVLFLDLVHPILKDRLEKMGYICVEEYSASYDEVSKIIGNYNGVVIRSRIKMDAAMLSKAKNLTFIARSGAGMENIDIDIATKNNIICFNAPEGNRNAVAEHVIGMLLGLFIKLTQGDREVRNLLWQREENRGVELRGKTVGIIGYGNTGSTLANHLRCFGCKILVYDKYLQDINDSYVEQVNLSTLQERADVISLHIPYTVETNYLIDRDFINTCKNNFYLVNTSRGKIVNTENLVSALESGKILGACLDVLEFEKSSFELDKQTDLPLPLQKLLTFNNVLLTPHVAGWTKESYYLLSSILADKIEKHFSV